VTIARAAMSLSFPLGLCWRRAMNPCPSGYFNDKSRECMCTPSMIKRYVSKVSGPLLDRIDIHIEVPEVQYKECGAGRRRRRRMRSRQGAGGAGAAACAVRQGGRADEGVAQRSFSANFCKLTEDTQQIRAYREFPSNAERLLEPAMQQQGLRARAHDRILMIARTIADLGGEQTIAVKHIAEAVWYRTLH
jgi:magnesium chelatase family protein